jgi:DNA-binding Xre family transcriptional regulator
VLRLNQPHERLRGTPAFDAAPTPRSARDGIGPEKTRAIYAAYLRGDGSIEKLADAIGSTCSALRRHLQKQNLTVDSCVEPGGRATSPAHAEQRVITGLMMAKVDELRKSRGMSVERLAHASDLSLWTLQKARRDLSDPRLTTILRLCRGLGVAAGELLDELPLPVETRPRRSLRSPQVQGER